MRKLPAFLLIAAATLPARAAGMLAAPGARATLQVEYVFESLGSRDREGGVIQWQVRRALNFNTVLAAEQALHAAGLHEPKASDADNMPQIGRDLQKIQVQCANDMACMQREMMKIAQQAQAIPELRSKDKSVQAAALYGPAHYQLWKPVSESGRYSIDEKHHTVDTDPLCLERPHERCTIDETRKGEGATPAPPAASPGASMALVEIDSTGNTLMMRLPKPLGELEYTRIYSSDKPGEKSGTATRKMKFPATDIEALQFTLQPGSRVLRGEQDVPLPARAGGGTLHVRWTMTLP